MTSDLDDLIRRTDPDRWLSSRFIGDAQARAEVVAIYAYDYELARAPKVASNSLLGEIRLTWWREMLDEAFDGRPVRLHPTAQALADVVRRRGLPREPLEAMIDARYRELDAAPMDPPEALAWARDTGGRAAELAALILAPGADVGPARAAGTAWAMSRRAADAPALAATAEKTLMGAREAVRSLDARAFPAAAHAALAVRRGAPVLDRLRLIWAVARGRI
ncbi:squalene/phytoene synthase family protein [Phenylobacterium sp. J426]|uniref:squalene/phytoene synthase family protein n=1 Tax=Phenylobacterium sp. J426 TaxID=2898439 RepID=UPI002150C467|nr:squalene/phytoene synthase family protein [Phenylobacterium sp. J426]MCR5876028.1 squalene/phytoene synthase family protein [Phenylobacterium sp. J426]